MNAINQLQAMDFFNNQSNKNPLDLGVKKESMSFHKVLEKKFDGNSRKNFSERKTDSSLDRNESVDRSRKKDFKKITEMISFQSNKPRNQEESKDLTLDTSGEKEVNKEQLVDNLGLLEEGVVLEEEEILLEAINFLITITNEETPITKEQVEQLVQIMQKIPLTEEQKNQITKLLSEISNLLENMDKGPLSKEERELINQKIHNIVDHVNMDQSLSSPEKLNSPGKIALKDNEKQENSMEINDQPQQVDKGKEISNKTNKEKPEDQKFSKDFAKALGNEKTPETNDPKTIDFTVNKSISVELLSKVSENGMPAKVNSNNILSQIVGQFSKAIKGGSSEIRIQLTPENLGKMSLKISSTDNTITAKIFAESAMVKDVIEANLNQLRSSLSEKGIVVSNIEVFVGQDSDAYRHRQEMQQKLKNKKPSITEIDGVNMAEGDPIEALSNAYLDVNLTSFDMMG